MSGPSAPAATRGSSAPRRRAGEVLHGDEAQFRLHSAMDALTVLTEDGRQPVLPCRDVALD